jgi:hypothetical protein
MTRNFEIDEHAAAQQRETSLQTSLPDTCYRSKRPETEALLCL